MNVNGQRREIARLRAKLRAEDQDFKAGAPELDEAGLPLWGGNPALGHEGYARVSQVWARALPLEELTDAERAAHDRLRPYVGVFAAMDDPSRAGGDSLTKVVGKRTGETHGKWLPGVGQA